LLIERRLFQRGSYFARAGTGAVRPVVIMSCPDRRAYGNYSPPTDAFATPYGLMPPGRGPEAPGFGLRYISRD
ncbi:hypothetical protein, partial [Klebsiella pneumoniae]|uniref:hypothetical protein n=1 Tax=Klebsiella pneumoniae TaxID=573 RepID=UPI003A810EAD